MVCVPASRLGTDLNTPQALAERVLLDLPQYVGVPVLHKDVCWIAFAYWRGTVYGAPDRWLTFAEHWSFHLGLQAGFHPRYSLGVSVADQG